MKTFKRILKWLGVGMGVYVLYGIALIAWGAYREPIAKKQAQDFCMSIKIGQATDGISEPAIASGAVLPFAKGTLQPDGTQSMMATYIGMPPISRHFGVVKAGSVVTSTEYKYMDCPATPNAAS
jgi:hypothetical protein